MNYITKLQTELAAAKAAQAEVLSEIIRMRAHLTSAKFQGEDADGSRRDWISVRDVDNFLVNLASQVYADVHGA